MVRTGDKYGSHILSGGMSHYLAGLDRVAYTKKPQKTSLSLTRMDYNAKRQIDEASVEVPGEKVGIPAGAEVVPQELYIGTNGMAREEQRLVGQLQPAVKQRRDPVKKPRASANYNV